MKYSIMATLLALALAALTLTGCGLGGESPKEPGQPQVQANPIPEERGTITSFSYAYGSGDQAVSYTLEIEDGLVYYTCESNGLGRPTPRQEVLGATLRELDGVVAAHSLHTWDGFDGSDPNVTDGTGFSLEITWSGGLAVTASGYETFPDGFQEGDRALRDFLDELSAHCVLNDFTGREMDAFHYHYGSYFGGYYEFDVVRDGSFVYFSAMGYNGVDLDVKNVMVDPVVLAELQELVERYDLGRWNGYADQDDDVLDGYSFSLDIGYTTGQRLTARGYEMPPPGYEEVHQQLHQYLGDHAQRLMAEQKEWGNLVSFSYTYGTSESGPYHNTLTAQGEEAHFIAQGPDGYEAEGMVPLKKLEDIQLMMDVYGLYSWDGFDYANEEFPEYALFEMEAVFDNGAVLRAQGKGAYPLNFTYCNDWFLDTLGGMVDELSA